MKDNKQYNLDADEIKNIESRHDLIKQYQYLIHVINSDIEAYVNFKVCKRLAIPEGSKYILSQDNKYITLQGDVENDKTSGK